MLLNPTQLRALLDDRTLQKVSDRTGISYATVQQIATGINQNPTYDTLQKLSDYFNNNTPEALHNGSTATR